LLFDYSYFEIILEHNHKSLKYFEFEFKLDVVSMLRIVKMIQLNNQSLKSEM